MKTLNWTIKEACEGITPCPCIWLVFSCVSSFTLYALQRSSINGIALLRPIWHGVGGYPLALKMFTTWASQV